MPVPQTGYDQASPNTPLWTFDAQGNLNLAGNVTIDAPLSIDGRFLLPGTAPLSPSALPLSLANGGTGSDYASLAALLAAMGLTKPMAPVTFTPSPTGLTTTSTTPVMMGLGALGTKPVLITPVGTGHVMVFISCTIWQVTGSANPLIGGRYGLVSGGIPANGAASTGTFFGGGVNSSAVAIDVTQRPEAATAGVTVVLKQLLTLTAGAQYWVDIAVTAPSSGNASSLQNVVIDAFELPT